MLGALPTQVAYGTQVKDLSLVIVQGGGPALLSRDWLWSYQVGLASHWLSFCEQGEVGDVAKVPIGFKDKLGTAKTVSV